MHDCCHCIYFALPSSYHPRDVTLYLPCENELWQATSAADWYAVLQRSSPYGTTQSSRLTGMSIPKMVAYLSETRSIQTAVPVSAFGHFVLIHITLKHLFQYCVGGKPEKPNTTGADDDEMDPEMLKLQFAMHNWLNNWKNSPDSRLETGSGEPPFIQNCMFLILLKFITDLICQQWCPSIGLARLLCSRIRRICLLSSWVRRTTSKWK
jgi:hypothetical protein